MRTRGSGVLLHVTSLPTRFGIGDLGPAADRFVDFLAAAGQRYWQVLPLHPTDPAYDNDPYHGTSAFALNPQLASPELMAADGLVDEAELGGPEPPAGDCIAFTCVIPHKERLFSLAHARFGEEGDREAFGRFCREQAWWLDDFALYCALRADSGGRPWHEWPVDLRRREPGAVREACVRLAGPMDRTRFLQFVVAGQWQRLHDRCRARGIRVIGDVPIYVDYDSADVWLHPEYFRLDDDLSPTVVSGVPPDAFSATGQLWGHPVYRWDALQADGFDWWVRRLERTLGLVDFLRIDHFRGLAAGWEVPAGATEATGGRWRPAPGRELLAAVARRLPCLPVIAEDLGLITPDVRELMREFRLPGMRVLLFAFDDGFASPHMPHNVVRDSIVYTGTHDNPTVRGWAADAPDEALARLREYLDRDVPADELPRAFVRLAMSTVANTVIVPMQDLLGLGPEARMNRPGTSEGNWRWRLSPDVPYDAVAADLRAMTRTFARR